NADDGEHSRKTATRHVRQPPWMSIYIFLHVAFEHLPADNGAVHVPLRIDAEALGAGMIGRGRFHVLDESRDLAVAHAADADAFLDAQELVRTRVGAGFGVGDVDGVVLGDVDAAGATELTPLIEQLAV